MAQEPNKAGLRESASIARIDKSGEPALAPGWYLYKGQAVHVYYHDNVLAARGYDFTTKSEWRLAAAELDRSCLARLEAKPL